VKKSISLIAGLCAVAAVAGLSAAPAMAGGVSVGVNIGVPAYVAPAPVYVAPAPVYVRPAPVYAAPPPVVVYRPAPVYAPGPVYVERDYYRGGPRHWRRPPHGQGHWHR